MGESDARALVPYGEGPLDIGSAAGGSLPALVEAAGPRAKKRFVEFFVAEIRNPKTRRAYAFAVRRFTDWCEARGVALERIEPVIVAAYVEGLQKELAAPSVKQHLAAIRACSTTSRRGLSFRVTRPPPSAAPGMSSKWGRPPSFPRRRPGRSSTRSIPERSWVSETGRSSP